MYVLLGPDGGRHDDRDPQAAVEGKLARLGPEDVRGPHAFGKAVEVLLQARPGDDPDLRRCQLLPDGFQVRSHLGAHAGQDVQPDLPPDDLLPEAAGNGVGDVDLRARAADAEGDGENPLAQRLAVLPPQEVLDVPPVQGPEPVQRVQVAQPLAQVPPQHVERPVAKTLGGEGKTGEPDALIRDSVFVEPPDRPAARDKIDDLAVAGILRHPRPVDLRVADDAVRRGVAGHVRRNGGRVERRDEGKGIVADGFQHSRAHSPLDQPFQPHDLDGRIGHVAHGIEAGDVLQLVQHAEDGVADERPALRAGKELVAPAQLLPEPVLRRGGVVGLAQGHDPVFRHVAKRPGSPLVAQAHVRGDDPCVQGFPGPRGLGETRAADHGGFLVVSLSFPCRCGFHPFSFAAGPWRAPGSPRSPQG